MAKLIVGRMDDNKVVEVEDYMNVLSAIRSAGYTKEEHEEIQDLEGNVYDGTEEVENGTSYFLVARVKSGHN